MRQYGCEQEGTKPSSRRDADAAQDARGRCAPRRPRPRAKCSRRPSDAHAHISFVAASSIRRTAISHHSCVNAFLRKMPIPHPEGLAIDRELKPLRVVRLARVAPGSHRHDKRDDVRRLVTVAKRHGYANPALVSLPRGQGAPSLARAPAAARGRYRLCLLRRLRRIGVGVA